MRFSIPSRPLNGMTRWWTGVLCEYPMNLEVGVSKEGLPRYFSFLFFCFRVIIIINFFLAYLGIKEVLYR